MECPDKLCESIINILNNDIVDHYIIHRWYHEDVELDVMWNGKVIGIDTDNKTGDPLILVNYWDTEGHKEDGEVSPINVFQFATDFYCEDMWFI